MMLKAILMTIFASVAAVTAAAGDLYPLLKVQKPDFAKIKAAVNDRKGPYYYPKLMEEYQRNDTVMRLEKYRHLYLGYMFQEDYDPYRPPYPVPEHVAALYGKEDLTKAQCDSVVRYARLSLDDNPLDMLQMEVLISALRQRGNSNLADIWAYRLRYLLMAIESTGTGLEKDSAFCIVETQHEYILLNRMGYRVTSSQFRQPTYEYLKVEDSHRNPSGYWFNLAPLLREYYRKHPDELDE